MTPGWYNAQGDPPGTQRYWDGSQWIGEPVYEPAPAPHVSPNLGAPPATRLFPGSLKTLAIVVAVVKAIPLALVLVLALALGVVLDGFDGNDFEDSVLSDADFDGLFRSAAAVLLGFTLIGVVLLGFQLVGAIKERPMMVFVPALIMSVLDALVTISWWAGSVSAPRSPFDNQSSGPPLLMTAVAAAQITIAVMAFKANKSQAIT